MIWTAASTDFIGSPRSDDLSMRHRESRKRKFSERGDPRPVPKPRIDLKPLKAILYHFP